MHYVGYKRLEELISVPNQTSASYVSIIFSLFHSRTVIESYVFISYVIRYVQPFAVLESKNTPQYLINTQF